MKQAYTEIESPVGRLLLAGDDAVLRALLFRDGPKEPSLTRTGPGPAPFRAVVAQLRAYFAGELQTFSVDLNPEGTTFQRLSGRSYRTYRMAKRFPTASSPQGSATRTRRVPSASPMDRTRSRSSSRVIASSVRMGS